MLPATLLRFSLCDVSFFIARELHKFDQIFKRSASSLQLSIFIRNDDYDEKIPLSVTLWNFYFFRVVWYWKRQSEKFGNVKLNMGHTWTLLWRLINKQVNIKWWPQKKRFSQRDFIMATFSSLKSVIKILLMI